MEKTIDFVLVKEKMIKGFWKIFGRYGKAIPGNLKHALVIAVKVKK